MPPMDIYLQGCNLKKTHSPSTNSLSVLCKSAIFFILSPAFTNYLLAIEEPRLLIQVLLPLIEYEQFYEHMS